MAATTDTGVVHSAPRTTATMPEAETEAGPAEPHDLSLWTRTNDSGSEDRHWVTALRCCEASTKGGDLEAALTHCSRAIDLASAGTAEGPTANEMACLYCNRGKLNLALGSYVAASNDGRCAVESDSENHEGHLIRGRGLLAMLRRRSSRGASSAMASRAEQAGSALKAALGCPDVPADARGHLEAEAREAEAYLMQLNPACNTQ